MAQPEERDPVEEFLAQAGGRISRGLGKLLLRGGAALIGHDKTLEAVREANDQKRRRDVFFAEGKARGEPIFVTLSRWTASEYDRRLAENKPPADSAGK